MIKILFIPSSTSGGVYYYRCFTPMLDLAKRYGDEFDITIDAHWTFTDIEKEEIGRNYDIVWIHNCLYMSNIQDEVWKTIIYCKKVYGTRFVLDIDDYWDFPSTHPSFEVCRMNAFPAKMMVNFQLFDYVTTTTEYFREVISQHFPRERVYVFENAISKDDSQFTKDKTSSDKVRIGLTGGSSHAAEIDRMIGFLRNLTESQLDRIEFVLCGYDTRNSERITIDEFGKIVSREKMDDSENWWVKLEDRILSMAKHYRRIETKDIVKGDFGHIYQDIDILLVPLDNNRFNRCKSELKFIESGWTQTAVIASNVIPYSNFGSNGKDCILVKENTPEEWAKAVKRLIRDRDTIDRLAKANSERVLRDRNIEIVGDRRADFIRKIMEAK